MAIACGNFPKSQSCAYCDQEGTRLCDGAVIASQSQVIHIQVTTMKTCDQPMCEEHSHRYGKNNDYCRAHRPAEETASDAK